MRLKVAQAKDAAHAAAACRPVVAPTILWHNMKIRKP